MARHNREGRGTDQRGYEYTIGYQPDWLRLVKVTRKLPSGRQSTMTLFKNPVSARQADSGEKVRTRITSVDQNLDVEISITDRKSAVKRIKVAYFVPRSGARGEEIVFTLDNNLRAPGAGR